MEKTITLNEQQQDLLYTIIVEYITKVGVDNTTKAIIDQLIDKLLEE